MKKLIEKKCLHSARARKRFWLGVIVLAVLVSAFGATLAIGRYQTEMQACQQSGRQAWECRAILTGRYRP